MMQTNFVQISFDRMSPNIDNLRAKRKFAKILRMEAKIRDREISQQFQSAETKFKGNKFKATKILIFFIVFVDGTRSYMERLEPAQVKMIRIF